MSYDLRVRVRVRVGVTVRIGVAPMSYELTLPESSTLLILALIWKLAPL